MPIVVDDYSKVMGINGLSFVQVRLFFEPDTKCNLFVLKNNKTVGATISEKRYTFLADNIKIKYPESINKPLGEFLLGRKLAGDKVYLRFLNRCGDETYSRFYFQDAYWMNRKGLYFYIVDGNIMYFGQSKDSFGKRINQGYGNISPKNCYLDGQSTNCHLNSLITQYREEVSLYLCELNDPVEIDLLEKNLIQIYQPTWNIALK